ncbi:hypothetical protein N9937_00065 [bacterium]|nr:hypothetical protein [bacterium]
MKTPETFTIGQKIECTDDTGHKNCVIGGIYTVKNVMPRNTPEGDLILTECGIACYAIRFKSANVHKHHEQIVAWAKGATIQFRNAHSLNSWVDVAGDPSWHMLDNEYRVKPPIDLVAIKTRYDATLAEIDKLGADMDRLMDSRDELLKVLEANDA